MKALGCSVMYLRARNKTDTSKQNKVAAAVCRSAEELTPGAPCADPVDYTRCDTPPQDDPSRCVTYT